MIIWLTTFSVFRFSLWLVACFAWIFIILAKKRLFHVSSHIASASKRLIHCCYFLSFSAFRPLAQSVPYSPFSTLTNIVLIRGWVWCSALEQGFAIFCTFLAILGIPVEKTLIKSVSVCPEGERWRNDFPWPPFSSSLKRSHHASCRSVNVLELSTQADVDSSPDPSKSLGN
jgi:hypothetical protein